MGKRKFFIMFIMLCGFFFLFSENSVKASEIVISEKPVSADIFYGQPLYISTLEGGVSNVEGTFFWKDFDKVLNVGKYEEIVVFTSVDGEEKEISVEISVLPARVYIEFEKELRKIYDGTDYIKDDCYIVKGIFDSSVYVKGDISVRLDSLFVGENIPVSIQGLSLDGEGKENYYLDLAGHTATIHPRYIEMFGNSKDRVDFVRDFIPVNASLHVAHRNDLDVYIDGYDTKKIVDIHLVDNGVVVDAKNEVIVKIELSQKDLDYKRMELYNYYNGEFQKLEYNYSDGQLVYSCVGLGSLVIVSKYYDYTWVYIVGGLLALIVIVCLVCIGRKRYNRIVRYKSIKRRKDYGNYL